MTTEFSHAGPRGLRSLFPPGQLAQLYSVLRRTRSFGRPSRRTIYRRIEVERARLAAAGHSQLELHLWCRHLTDPENLNAKDRLYRWIAGAVDDWSENLPVR